MSGGAVTIRHKATKIELRFDPEDNHVYSENDGKCEHFASENAARLLCAIVDAFPSVIESKEVGDILRVSSKFDEAQVIYKKMSEIKRVVLEVVSDSVDTVNETRYPIAQVRKRGYKLASGWEIIRNDYHDSYEIGENVRRIASVLRKCQELVRTTKTEESAAKIRYIRADESFLLENVSELNSCMWSIIRAVSDRKIVPNVIRIKSCIDEILTYALLWRVGDELDEEKWKNDYRDEVESLIADLEYLALSSKKVK